MITLYGVTEDGTTVPVQVTEDGKLVVHKEGGYTPGMDLEANNITATGQLNTAGAVTCGPWNKDSASGKGCKLADGGTIHAQREANFSGASDLFTGWKGTDRVFQVSPSGNVNAEGGISTAGSFRAGPYDPSSDAVEGVSVNWSGGVYIQRPSDYSGGGHLMRGYRGKKIVYNVTKWGGISCCESKAGITTDGEIFFTSRGVRYKIVVQNGMCMADTYTREQQIRDGLDPDVDTTDIVRPD